MLAHAVGEREAVGDVVDGIHQQARVLRPRRAQQIEARRVAVEHLVAELAQQIDLLGVVIEHDGAHAVGEQQPGDDLAEAPEAGDDHRIARFVDRVVGALRRAGSPRGQLVVREEHQRRRRHRERHGDGQLPCRLGGEDAGRLRHAEHDERELAALREQRGEEPALPRRRRP